MHELFLYLLKVNVALLLFYGIYYFALRRLTFYTLNRFFLAFGIVFSSAYPFVDFSQILQQHETLQSQIAVIAPAWYTVDALPLTEQAPAFDWWQLVAILFWSGAAFMFLRLTLQLLSLRRIHARSNAEMHLDFTFRRIRDKINPFSFWQSIYLNPEQHQKEDLLPIFQHEQIHVKEWHTLDVLLAELNTVIYWFNPGSWFMLLAVKQNLEFIADRNALRSGLDSKVYQYSLIRISSLSRGSALVNNFNFLTIKNRIVMMNRNPSARAHLLKFLIAVPVAAALLLTSTGTAQKQDSIVERIVTEVRTDKPAQGQPDLPEDQKTFLKRNPTVKSISWLSHDMDKMVISLKSGSTEVYDLNDSQSISAARSKYGKLPAVPPPPVPGEELPPPPPPAAEENLPPPPPPAPSSQHLPPPPPPAKHHAPLFPAETTAKLVADENTVTYILRPGDITKEDLTTAEKAFKESGFDLELDGQFSGDKLVNLKISLSSPKTGDKATAVYTAASLQSLHEANNVAVIKADKRTRELIIGNTIAP